MFDLAISSIEFSNYRCLRDVTIDLGPLTVLVGGNATGKSTALRALCSQPQSSLERSDASVQSPDQDVSIEIHTQLGKVVKTLRRDGTKFRSECGDPWPASQFLQLDLSCMRASNQTERVQRLETSGHGLTNLLNSLPRRTQEEVSKRFCTLVPLYADVDTVPLSTGNILLHFQDRWNHKVWYQPERVSDGTMLALAYLLLLYQEPQVDLIAVEEPERGLHPYLLGELMRLFHAMSSGQLGLRPVQIVLATHSAELLNQLQPDEVRFLSRDHENGGTSVSRPSTDDPDWKRAYYRYDSELGSMWLSGALGGVPGS